MTEEMQDPETLRQWGDAFLHCGHGIAMGSPETGRLLACNTAFAALCGWPQSALVGRPILELYPSEFHERVKTYMLEADRLGRVEYESQFVRPDGSRVDVRVDLVSVRDAAGVLKNRVATAQDITREKATAESLHVARDRLQAIDRAAPIPIIALDPAGIIIHWNHAAELLFGWRAEEALGRPIPIVPEDKQGEYLSFRASALSGISFTRRTERVTRDGRRVEVQLSTAPLHDEAGVRIGLMALYVDLTEQRSLEQALRASEQRFGLAFRASSSASILIREADRVVLEVNPAMEQLTGYSSRELMGRSTEDLPVFTAQPGREELWQRLRTEGRVDQLDYPFRRRDGTMRHTLASAERLSLGGERVLLGNLVDVTDRYLAEQALRESEGLLRLFIEHAPSSLAMFDREMRYLQASRRWRSDYNLGDLPLLGRSHYEVFPEISDQWKALHRRALNGEILQSDLDRFERADGSVQWLRWEVRPWRDATGEVGGIVIFAEDITTARNAQESIRESEARFRQLAENIREVFWLTDVEKGRVIYVSPGYDEVWGRSGANLVQNPREWIEAIHPDDRDRIMLAATTKQAAGTYDEEYRVVRPDGAVRWIRDRAFPVRDEYGVVTRIAGVAEDVTARRQLELQVRQSQKMESVGLLAGGVAHDFNNWLTVISSSAELLSTVVGQDPEAVELVGEIKHAGERAANLTRQLLAFSRREVVEPRILNLNEIVLDVRKMLPRLLGEDVILETNLADGLRRTRVDRGQWTQVLVNLAVNARDAMPAGGRLTMETGNFVVDEAFAANRPALKPGPYIVLAVSDTGAGMSPEVQAHAFEPFFTTKPQGQGTGLGLAVTHGIVSQSGGQIEIYSEVGLGTTFRIYLPSADEEEAGLDGPAVPENLNGTETILVVEDEGSIRNVVGRGLRARGYVVLEAGDGYAALSELEHHGDTIDLVITDVVMPGMSGRTLAESLERDYPHIKVLFTSGYTDDAVVRHGVLQAEVAFLSKPYTPRSLQRKVRMLLDNR